MKPAPLAAALALLGAAAVPAAERCGVCHPDVRVAFAESVHSREQVGCTGCHGGDPESLEVEPAHRGRFRGLGDRREIPRLCAECHADLSKMRPYNLPVDQYATYLTSQHGIAAAAGDRRAAVCTDCHGVHDLRPADDPTSSVNYRRLPATCGACHGDETLMQDHGLDTGVVADYRASVHGRALLDRGNLAAPNCTSCHGVHGATPPGVGDIDKVCGACHVQTRRAFLAGPHFQGMLAAGLPECSSCHSNHAIQRFEVADIDGLCAGCHGEGSEAAALGSQLRTLIRSAQEEIEKAEALVAKAQRVPLHVEDYLGRIEEARTYLTEALPLFHAVSLEPVDRFTRRARSIGEEVQHELYVKLEPRGARLGLVVFWFYLLMTLAILLTYRRRLRRGEGSAQ